MMFFAPRKVLLPVLFLSGLLGCGGETDDVSGDSAAPIGILVADIQSPLDGATVTEGDEVFLQVQVGYEDGDSVEADSVAWSVEGGSWSADGNGLSVTDLPVGALQLLAVVEVDRFVLSDTVSLTVEQKADDPPLTLSGNLDAAVKITDSNGIPYSDDCDGVVEFQLDGSELTGTGDCSAFNEDLSFLITGEVNQGQVTGEMGVSGGEENVPFTGQWDEANEVLTGQFDETWTSSDGTLRLWGTFQAVVN